MTRILITSALPYINGIKHLGNLAGSMLPADVHARYHRLRGREVLALCATDEHGTPAEIAAEKAGMSVQEYCDEQHEQQKKTGEAFGLSWDWFGRTSDMENKRLTQHFAEKLATEGLVEERITQQIYSPADGRFLPDRYVEGTCPHCEHRPARGDQCDHCGRLLDPVDLLDPYSTLSGSHHLEKRETRHLFLLQSKFADKLRTWVDGQTGWPALARSIAYKWLDEGLQDRGITRDLSWGVPITQNGAPRPGFENKVFYVWFDAPIGYIASAETWAHARGENWRRWWRLDEGAEDVRYIQFMGKDNVAFHALSFPTTLLGSREPWKTVDSLKAFNWLTWYGGKFSTSKKRGVFMDQALELLPADYWRWYLTAHAPESADSAFSWEHFQSLVNKDLADVFGNFINRIMRFATSRFDGCVPEGGEESELERNLWAELKQRLKALADHHEAMEFRKAAAETRTIWALGNEYLQQAEPWTHVKTDRERAAFVVRTGLSLCPLFALIASPIIPKTAQKVLKAFGKNPEKERWPDHSQPVTLLEPGEVFETLPALFQKIDDKTIENWARRFGGRPEGN